MRDFWVPCIFPVWFWFFAYIVYPFVSAWLAWRDRHQRLDAVTTPLASWIRVFALVLGVVSGTLALMLFLAPASIQRRRRARTHAATERRQTHLRSVS